MAGRCCLKRCLSSFFTAESCCMDFPKLSLLASVKSYKKSFSIWGRPGAPHTTMPTVSLNALEIYWQNQRKTPIIIMLCVCRRCRVRSVRGHEATRAGHHDNFRTSSQSWVLSSHQNSLFFKHRAKTFFFFLTVRIIFCGWKSLKWDDDENFFIQNLMFSLLSHCVCVCWGWSQWSWERWEKVRKFQVELIFCSKFCGFRGELFSLNSRQGGHVHGSGNTL